MARGMQAMQEAADEQYEAAISQAFRQGKARQPRFQDVFEDSAFKDLRRKCRKIAESPEGWPVLNRLLCFSRSWVNDVDSWKPKGKALHTLLRSLIKHLLCKYPMPPFWFEVWFREEGGLYDDEFCEMFVKLAQGSGMMALVKDCTFPVEFTKKQAHTFMQQRKINTVVHAVRWTQVQSFGGDRSLAEALCDTAWGRHLRPRLVETFRTTVIQWFAGQGMLEMTQIGPLLDYIEHCRRENPQWAIRGRTATSLMRDMEAWHQELAAAQPVRRDTARAVRPPPEKFKSTELEGWSFSRETKDKRTGRKVHENHTVQEILTYQRLQDEGRALHHCVRSYVWNIERGATSIWSYCVDGENVLTIELHNPTRSVRQIRGLRNRMPTSSEVNYLQRWAVKAGVVIPPRAVRKGW